MIKQKSITSHYFSGRAVGHESFVDMLETIDTYSYLPKKSIRLLYSAISEVFLNISHHAYKNDNEHLWEAYVDALPDRITLQVRDFGIGIPNSLNFDGNIKSISDASLIMRALSTHSCISDCNRGTGLSSIQSLVHGNILDYIKIHSQNGLVYYAGNTKQLKDLPSTLQGTLIEISILKEGTFQC